MKTYQLFVLIICWQAANLTGANVETRQSPIRVLIVDGQNNHDWRITSDALRATLNSAGLFNVTTSSAPQIRAHRPPRQPRSQDKHLLEQYRQAVERYRGKTADAKKELDASFSDWLPDFGSFDVVVLNYNGRNWPEPMRQAFSKYVGGGGGVVVIHAANNAFRDWNEFNDIIGMGWRKGGFGKCLKIDPKTKQPYACCPDKNSGHGSKHPFEVTVRKPEHPIMKGIPATWMHGRDELYHHMRGPAKNLSILSSAYSDPKTNGTGFHEPITWEVKYGKGRAIITSMGHFWPNQDWWDSLYCVGFQTIFARSVEYAATGGVTLDCPKLFPDSKKPSIVSPHELTWTVAGKPTVPAEKKDEIWKTLKDKSVAAKLTPTQSIAAFQLADGFVIEPVATEPMVEEPVLAVWDGNGAMYVAEMRSYMQDEKGTGTKSLRNGRIKRLVDTNGDGVMDKATIFIDKLQLPRMILPLDDRIAVVETDTTDVHSYRDTNGDGIADEKILLFDGYEHAPTKSVEHQDSGLVWNLDNWIYFSYGHRRYRFTDGKWREQKLLNHWAQWGLDRDDVGRIYYSANSEPVKSVDLPRPYWSLIHKRSGYGPPGGDPLSLGDLYDAEFMEVVNLCPINDRGGKASASKRFTSACGQSVYRGHALPRLVYGNYFVCDPTIHAVRRALIENDNGRMVFSNAYWGEEFLVSPDVNFRPVNTATGPDGCFYVIDMSRGIIQDAPWLSEGPRKFIRESGLSKNIMHGRIWRVRHKDHQPGRTPRMLNESTVQLLRHLQNPNGWWRDTAQKLIILRDDRESVAPLLRDMVRFDDNPLSRLHALWVLEGMDGIDLELLRDAARDRDTRLRVAIVKLAEPWIEKGDANGLELLKSLISDRSPEVGKQLILSLAMWPDKKTTPMIEQIVESHIAHNGVRLAGLIVLWGDETGVVKRMKDGSAFAKVKNEAERIQAAKAWLGGIEQWKRALKLPDAMPKVQRDLVKRGQSLFYQSCVSCHGADGNGVRVSGLAHTLAPPLAGSPRVKDDPKILLRILMQGLTGPVDGKTYEAGKMVPIGTFGIKRDDRIAELMSFIRYAWGNDSSHITKDEVIKIRKTLSNRVEPWTLEELKSHASPR